MNKYYVLQDENTGKYFTDRWGNYWDRDIDMAKIYSTSEDMDSVIDYMYSNNDNILDGVKNIILVTLYSKN